MIQEWNGALEAFTRCVQQDIEIGYLTITNRFTSNSRPSKTILSVKYSIEKLGRTWELYIWN